MKELRMFRAVAFRLAAYLPFLKWDFRQLQVLIAKRGPINECGVLQRRYFITCSIILLCFCLPGIGLSQEGSSEKPNDLISKIVAERTFDFGEVRIGSSATHSFKFFNPTDRELRIQSASSSCGCTVANISNKAIAPGQTESITISLNTESFRGRKESTIQVRFEEPDDFEIQLRLSVDIKNLYVDPEFVEFRSVRVSQPVSKQIVVTRKGSPYWKIESIRSNCEALRAKITRRSIRGNEVSYEIECSLLIDNDGIIRAELLIATNDSAEKEYRIPVFIESTPMVQSSVSEIDFGISKVGEKRMFIIKSIKPCEITSLNITGSGFSVSEPKPERKENHLLQVVRNSMDQKAATIKIKTDASEEEILVEVLAEAQRIQDNDTEPTSQR
jgi:hypothetical protein